MRKRVYKFVAPQHAVSNLKNNRLKLSTIGGLNDPFDLCPLDTSDPAVSKAAEFLISHFWERKAILCLSRSWDNLLLWSHYGAAHTGVCLGFDIPDCDPDTNFDTDVIYQPNLLQICRQVELNFDLANRMLRTKHESWSYEQEVRMFASLNDPADEKGLHWIEFGPHLVLKEVIIGAQCHPSMSKKIEEAIQPHGEAVTCWWAGMRTDAFQLIKQAHPPHWYATVK